MLKANDIETNPGPPSKCSLWTCFNDRMMMGDVGVIIYYCLIEFRTERR